MAAGTHTVSQVLPLGWSNTLPAVNVGALEPQIVGGEDAAIGDSPWMAGIIYTNGTLSFEDEDGLGATVRENGGQRPQRAIPSRCRSAKGRR